MTWYGTAILDGLNSKALAIGWLHDYVLSLMIGVLAVVLVVAAWMGSSTYVWPRLVEWPWLELWWTLLPLGVLLAVAVPRFRLLYTYEPTGVSWPSLGVVGHQWYWSYELLEWGVALDSFGVAEAELEPGGLRMLEVDARPVLPLQLPVRAVVSSADVLHSWALQPLGIKVDACPGRLNVTGFSCDHVGLVYGQCSELCGAQHPFMPVCVEVAPLARFVSWVVAAAAD